jgi:hypothetical protein
MKLRELSIIRRLNKMKITKADLRQLIRETLREELAKKPLKEELDPVDQILNKLPDYELEYEGYDYEWYRDKWNYNTMDHDQDYGTDHYDDFTYSVDATSLYETVFEILQEKVSGPVTDKLMIECKKLMQAWWQVSDDKDKEAEPLAAVELFVAQNLFEFADMCYEELLKEYEDSAYEDKPARD